MDKKPVETNIGNLLRMTSTISESFAKLRFVTVASLVGMVVCAVVCVVYSTRSISAIGDKIYVLDSGQVMTASRRDVSVSRADEVRDQAVRLHEYLFSVSPNKEMVTRNLEQALKISDRSVYNYYKDVDETGFYRRLSQNGAVQDIVVDSVRTDTRQYPYPVVTYATITMTRQSLMSRYSLVSRCSMVEVGRNADNLHGLMVERFEVVSNQKIDERKR